MIDKVLALYLGHCVDNLMLNQIDALVAAQLTTYGWIVTTVNNDFDTITLITKTGALAIDIARGNTATEPAPASASTGERWYYEWGENVVRDRQSATRLYADGKKAKFDITATLNEYEGKLAAATSELLAAQTESAANADTANDYKREAEHLKTVRDGLEKDIAKLRKNAQIIAKNALELEDTAATQQTELYRLRVVLQETYLHLTVGDDTAEYKIQNAIEELLPNVPPED